ncbi:hypothetical protein PFFVO_05963, partial [Plasmodium falciparum Vietnam Oak-Knoll (FVO)]
MARGGGQVGGDGIEDGTTKHLLDSIGKIVHDLVKKEAADYRNALQGHLENAIFEKDPNDQQTPQDPCLLIHEYHTTATEGHNKENPCEKRSNVRFSYTEGSECNKSKIKGNKDNEDKEGKSEGACAPFRRLSLCDYNLENISDFDHINNHTLLADVCLAAKFEGESITQNHGKYQLSYPDSHYEICTMLARSFADIGDIVRGRDLYRGDNREKTKLEKKLKKIFGIIYGKLDKKDRYQNDGDNYFQLREDWWTENRETVWKAITCGHPGGTYFRRTCSNDQRRTNHNCRCAAGDVPTYFDYVPQYLRWFEEWAEEFCRKKKHKLKDVKTNCRERNKDDEERYCDRNGFDCERTIYKESYFVIDKGCNTCSVSCRPYESWIDNQKKEFLKQKNKYADEINGASGIRRLRRAATTSNYDNGYEKKFYEELKGNYSDVNDFLGLLNNEKACKEVQDDKGGTIHFEKVNSGSTNGDGDGSNKTFSHSEYCQPCPDCGVEHLGGGIFKKKNENKSGECEVAKNVYNRPDGVKEHYINFLYSGDGKQDITEKLKEFCEKQHKEDVKKNEKWQ